MGSDEIIECPICTTEVKKGTERCPLCSEPLVEQEPEMIECPTCSSEVEEGTTECPLCGEPLVEKESVMIECPTCSSEVEEETMECPLCGELLFEQKSENIECPNCSSEVEVGTLECPLCGELLVEEGPPMIECPNCSTVVEEGTPECPKCGELLVEEGTPMIVCPTCSTEVEEGTLECPLCAEPLVEQQPDELIDDFADLEECKEREHEMIFQKTSMFPVMTSVLCSFLIPMFLVLFIGLELFISLATFPNIYPSSPLVHLTLFSYITRYWLSALVVSFIAVFILFLSVLTSLNFDDKEKSIVFDKKPLGLSFALTVFLIISLGLYTFRAVYYPGQIVSYIVLFLLMISGITQADLIFEPGQVNITRSAIEEDFEEEVEEEVKTPSLEEEMDELLSQARGMVKEVRKMKVGVSPIKVLMKEALIARRDREMERLKSVVDEIEKHTEDIIELKETMELCEDQIVETKKDGMDPQPYIDKMELAMEQAENGFYKEAKGTLSFLLVDIIHEKPDVEECPVCATEVEEGEDKCPMCGEPLTKEAKDEEVLDSLEDLLENIE